MSYFQRIFSYCLPSLFYDTLCIHPLAWSRWHMTWTASLNNKNSGIRTRAFWAPTSVLSGSLTAILRIIKIHLKPCHKSAQQTQINSKKNLYLSAFWEMCKWEERVPDECALLYSIVSSHPSDLPFLKCSWLPQP